MFKEVLFLVFVVLLGGRSGSAAPAPTAAANSNPQKATSHIQSTEEDPAQAHVISIDHFESLLRRAGEMFNPARFQLVDSTPEQHRSGLKTPASQPVAVPYQQMQPPTEQPFNFYLPLFEYDNAQLDEKSRKLEKFTPPPAPEQQQDATNYYAAKPKKLPKKFSADAKLINVKWLNTFEKEALAGPNGNIPQAVYLLHDARNRINFDDSFFADNFYVKSPDNEPHKQSPLNSDDEDMGEEDLIAAPAVQVPHVNYNYRGQTPQRRPISH